MSTVDSRAYNIELHTLNCKSDFSGMNAALNIWVDNWTSIMRDYNLSIGLTIWNFRFTTRSRSLQYGVQWYCTFVSVRSNADPCILQSWMLSSLKSRPNPPKNYGMSVGDMTSAKISCSLALFISTCFCSSQSHKYWSSKTHGSQIICETQCTLLQVADRLTSLQHQNIHKGRAVCSVIHLSHAVCKIIFLIFHLLDS